MIPNSTKKRQVINRFRLILSGGLIVIPCLFFLLDLFDDANEWVFYSAALVVVGGVIVFLYEMQEMIGISFEEEMIIRKKPTERDKRD